MVGTNTAVLYGILLVASTCTGSILPAMPASKEQKRGRAFKCQECGKVGDRPNMKWHYLKSHAPLEMVPYYCILCKYRANKRKSLEEHLYKWAPHKTAACSMGIDLKDKQCLREAEKGFIFKIVDKVEDGGHLLLLSQHESQAYFRTKLRKPAADPSIKEQLESLLDDKSKQLLAKLLVSVNTEESAGGDDEEEVEEGEILDSMANQIEVLITSDSLPEKDSDSNDFVLAQKTNVTEISKKEGKNVPKAPEKLVKQSENTDQEVMQIGHQVSTEKISESLSNQFVSKEKNEILLNGAEESTRKKEKMNAIDMTNFERKEKEASRLDEERKRKEEELRKLENERKEKEREVKKLEEKRKLYKQKEVEREKSTLKNDRKKNDSETKREKEKNARKLDGQEKKRKESEAKKLKEKEEIIFRNKEDWQKESKRDEENMKSRVDDKVVKEMNDGKVKSKHQFEMNIEDESSFVPDYNEDMRNAEAEEFKKTQEYHQTLVSKLTQISSQLADLPTQLTMAVSLKPAISSTEAVTQLRRIRMELGDTRAELYAVKVASEKLTKVAQSMEVTQKRISLCLDSWNQKIGNLLSLNLQVMQELLKTIQTNNGARVLDQEFEEMWRNPEKENSKVHLVTLEERKEQRMKRHPMDQGRWQPFKRQRQY